MGDVDARAMARGASGLDQAYAEQANIGEFMKEMTRTSSEPSVLAGFGGE
jgi:hypothetical protein